MNQVIQTTAVAVQRMDEHLRNDLLKKEGQIQSGKLWENTYIKRQIDKRQADGAFSIRDHIRAMVYSMLSSGIVWDRVSDLIDEATKHLIPIDDAFCQYDPERLLTCTPKYLSGKVKELRCAGQYTAKQMEALIQVNIPKLLQMEQEYGSIDAFYQQSITKDATLKDLVKLLSAPDSNCKLAQMGEALTAEYLKNVGYDIAKPDRHILRIFGRILNRPEIKTLEAIDIVAEIAKEASRPAAEVDYILWSYCATGYGEICTAKNPKCDICAARTICHAAE